MSKTNSRQALNRYLADNSSKFKQKGFSKQITQNIFDPEPRLDMQPKLPLAEIIELYAPNTDKVLFYPEIGYTFNYNISNQYGRAVYIKPKINNIIRPSIKLLRSNLTSVNTGFKPKLNPYQAFTRKYTNFNKINNLSSPDEYKVFQVEHSLDYKALPKSKSKPIIFHNDIAATPKLGEYIKRYVPRTQSISFTEGEVANHIYNQKLSQKLRKPVFIYPPYYGIYKRKSARLAKIEARNAKRAENRAYYANIFRKISPSSSQYNLRSSK